jgi:hypothetical protein
MALVLVATAVAGTGVAVAGDRGRWTTLFSRERCEFQAQGPRVSLHSEQAASAASIVSVGQDLGLPQRALVIAVATAMQESNLRNIDYGDRDSVGLFQQRPSQGWGTAEQIRDPRYAATRFYDALAQIPGYADLTLTDAAQRVQRSAFGNAYAKHEPAATTIAGALTTDPVGVTCALNGTDTAQALAPLQCGPGQQRERDGWGRVVVPCSIIGVA